MIVAAIVIILTIGGLCLYTSIKDKQERTDPSNLDSLDNTEE